MNKDNTNIQIVGEVTINGFSQNKRQCLITKTE